MPLESLTLLGLWRSPDLRWVLRVRVDGLQRYRLLKAVASHNDFLAVAIYRNFLVLIMTQHLCLLLGRWWALRHRELALASERAIKLGVAGALTDHQLVVVRVVMDVVGVADVRHEVLL